jgi:hypothetical protein
MAYIYHNGRKMMYKSSANRYQTILVLWFVSFVFLLFYSYSTSPLHIIPGFDSEIFQIIGRGWLIGKIPYRDLFDHKGPYLFLFNAIGLSFGKAGLFLLQTMMLTINLFIISKISSLFTNKINSIFVMCFFLLLFSGLIENGNQCEEWELLFLLLPIYLSIKHFLTQKSHPLLYSFCYGACFGVVSFIRLNDASIIASICLGLIVKTAKEKKYKEILYNLLIFILGILVSVLPFCIYFYLNDSFFDMIYATFTHNLIYSNKSLQVTFTSILDRLSILGVPIALSFKAIRDFDKNSGNSLSYILILSLLILFFSVGSDNLPHYFIVVLPLFCVICSILFAQNKPFAIILMIIVFMPFILLSFTQRGAYLVKNNFINRRNAVINFYNQMDTVIAELEEGDIWSYNLGHHEIPLFNHYNIIPVNKYFIASHLITDKLHHENNKQLTSIFPKYMLVNDSEPKQENYDFIIANYNIIHKVKSYNNIDILILERDR